MGVSVCAMINLAAVDQRLQHITRRFDVYDVHEAQRLCQHGQIEDLPEA